MGTTSNEGNYSFKIDKACIYTHLIHFKINNLNLYAPKAFFDTHLKHWGCNIPLWAQVLFSPNLLDLTVLYEKNGRSTLPNKEKKRIKIQGSSILSIKIFKEGN